VLVAAATLATVAVALWFTLLKPTIQSAATQAVTQQTQQLAASAQKANNAADQANQAAKDAVTVAAAALDGGQKHTKAAATKKPKATPSAKNSVKKTADAMASPSATASAGGASPVSGFLRANASPGSAYATYTYPIAKGGTLNVSDIVLENPMGDSGLLQIRAGSQVLFEFGLADFRDLDYHFVQALQFTPAAPLTLAVQCADTGGKHCTAALSFSGTLAK